MDETIVGYVTKYALTAGIQKRRLRISSSTGLVATADHPPIYFHGAGKEWHRTWESALARAEKMRADKIASLQKSIAKLEMMEFKQP